uniref:Uncharacterized protein n=1 Tax=Fagus sylvatica TaxID=28930 RepID=A0A2N9GRU4_FAGSY
MANQQANDFLLSSPTSLLCKPPPAIALTTAEHERACLALEAVVGGCSWQHKFLFVVFEILLVEWVELVTMWFVILVKMGLALCLVAGKMEEQSGFDV